jgi:hypothetical protein
MIFQIGCEPMKKQTKKLLLIIIASFLLVIASFAVNFYIQLSGNPIEGWKEKRALLRLYEEKYGKDFKVTYKSYDYKRHEFSFTMHPESDHESSFRTTLYETEQNDAYGELRAGRFLRDLVMEAIGSDYDYLDYSMNVFEEYDSPGLLEGDLNKRLAMNHYNIDFSWDVEKTDPVEIDRVFMDNIERIEEKLTFPIRGIIIRNGVFDGEDYHHNQVVLPN